MFTTVSRVPFHPIAVTDISRVADGRVPSWIIPTGFGTHEVAVPTVRVRHRTTVVGVPGYPIAMADLARGADRRIPSVVVVAGIFGRGRGRSGRGFHLAVVIEFLFDLENIVVDFRFLLDEGPVAAPATVHGLVPLVGDGVSPTVQRGLVVFDALVGVLDLGAFVRLGHFLHANGRVGRLAAALVPLAGVLGIQRAVRFAGLHAGFHTGDAAGLRAGVHARIVTAG